MRGRVSDLVEAEGSDVIAIAHNFQGYDSYLY